MSRTTYVLYVVLQSVALCSVLVTCLEPPLLAFTQTGDRSLIKSNNPEQLTPADIADSPVSISVLRIDSVVGKARDWWEHENTGIGETMGWGIIVSNPSNSETVTVTVTGRGVVDALNGGQPFVDVFMNPISEVHKLDPMGYLWILRNDSIAAAGTIFSGVVDFETDKPVRVDNVCYRSYSRINPKALQYEGYITRVDPGPDHEARVYKGIAPVADVSTLLLEFSVDDSDARGAYLPVKYPLFDLNTLSYGTPQQRNGWTTNISPHASPYAVSTDMVSFYMPGWGIIDPMRCCDGAGMYPNLGNYGIVYHIHATVSNTGSLTRYVSLNLTSPVGCYVEMAYACGPDDDADRVWRPLNLGSGAVFEYCGVKVGPKQSQKLDAAYVLGGPACGNIYHTLSLTQ